ncbi:MAG: tRNA dihydrouridine synthase, partial [Planctomycetota bacterium]
MEPPRIGTIPLDPPFLLGGLAGYGEPLFRSLCRRLGASTVVAPMILDKALIAFHRSGETLPKPRAEESPVIGQLLGADPPTLAEAAKILEAQEFHAVDLNMACPAPKVLHRFRGGRLLTDPERAKAIFEAVRESVSLPVTLKMRWGFSDQPESARCAWRILEFARAAGLAAVTIHPRTVAQRFRDQSRWEVLTEAKGAFPGMVLIG